MEENISKYYIPLIEDFYVGFEFEQQVLGLTNTTCLDRGKWNTCIYRGNDIRVIKSFIESENIRVKFLDKTDIESFGFVEKYEYNGDTIKYNSFVKDGYWLQYFNTTLSIKHMNKEDTGKSYFIFIGTIKNKSELKVLLTQLGIDYETK